ncbi:MAG: DUF3592 domain-containing protein [Xanthobacteraceae bacterium]
MGGNRFFWQLFGSIWLVVGVAFLAASFGVNLFANPNQLDGGSPLLFAAAGVVVAAAGGTIIYFAQAAAARDRRLMQSGIQITATVIDIERSWIAINRQTRWHVVYRYEYTKGRPLDGKSHALPGEAVQGYRPGDQVTIKVDPQKPAESLFLGEIAGPSRP